MHYVLVLMVVAIVAILVAIVFVAIGQGGEMAHFPNDYAPPEFGAMAATDVALLRPPTALWGYHMQATDEALNSIALALSDRDVRIASLERQLADARDPREAVGVRVARAGVPMTTTTARPPTPGPASGPPSAGPPSAVPATAVLPTPGPPGQVRRGPFRRRPFRRQQAPERQTRPRQFGRWKFQAAAAAAPPTPRASSGAVRDADPLGAEMAAATAGSAMHPVPVLPNAGQGQRW